MSVVPGTISDQNAIEVPKELFFNGMILPVTAYLKLKANTYLEVGRKGERADLNALHAFQRKDSKVFVTTDDYPFFMMAAKVMTMKLVASTEVPIKLKGKFLLGLLDDAMLSLERGGFTNIDKVQQLSQTMISITKSSLALENVFAIVQELPESHVRHSMATALLSLVLADELGINQPQVIENLSLGAILHDVGLRFLPQTLLSVPQNEWTPTQKKEYENHPILGAENLKRTPGLSLDTLLIIAEHHENAVGTGFPKKMRDIRMSPLAKIVTLANQCVELMMPDGLVESVAPEEAVRYIEEVLEQPYNKKVFAALIELRKKNALSSANKKVS